MVPMLEIVAVSAGRGRLAIPAAMAAMG